jgi:hypothetical protein
MKKPFLIVLFLSILTSMAQTSGNKPINKPRNYGICWNIGGPTLITSISGNQFVTPNFKIESGFGLLGGFVGGSYHLGKSKSGKTRPYAGAYITGINGNPIYYVPVGFGLIGKNGFGFSIELAYAGKVGEYVESFWGGIKLGYYFTK